VNDFLKPSRIYNTITASSKEMNCSKESGERTNEVFRDTKSKNVFFYLKNIVAFIVKNIDTIIFLHVSLENLILHM